MGPKEEFSRSKAKKGGRKLYEFGKLFVVFVVVLSFFALALFSFQDLIFPKAQEFAVFKGKEIKNVSVYSQEGLKENLHQILEDKSKLIVFWATWCPPCIGEIKMILKKVEEKKIAPDKVLFLNCDSGSSVSSVLSKVKEWQRKNKLNFTSFFDPAMSLVETLRVSALPFSLKVQGPRRVIQWMKMDVLSEEDLQR